MVYPALVSITFRQLSVQQIVNLCKENGLKAVEWGSDVHLIPGDIEQAKYIKNLCEENDIVVASYASYYALGANENYKEEFQKYIDCARELGTKVIRLWATREASDTFSPERLEKVYKEVNELSDIAEQDGIVLSYEFHHITLTDTLESTQKLLKNAPKTQTHWQQPIGMPFDECLEQVKALKNDIRNFHVNNRHADMKYYALREIKGQWFDYLSELKDRPDDIYACLEFMKGKEIEQFVDDANTLTSIIQEIYA